MDKISIVVPCYNEEESLPLFYREVSKVMEGIPDTETEFIFVDDGSKTTPSWSSKALSKDPRCNYFSFSRNFGKEAAMYAGFEHANRRLLRDYGRRFAASAGSASGNVQGSQPGGLRLLRRLPGGPGRRRKLRNFLSRRSFIR